MFDEEARIESRDVVRVAHRLRYNLSKSRYNHKAKISIITLGELTYIALRENYPKLIDELNNFKNDMGERLEFLFVPRLFNNNYRNFVDVLDKLLSCDYRLREEPVDALILTFAVLDKEADVFYTTTLHILRSIRLKETINSIREECGFKKLNIKPLS